MGDKAQSDFLFGRFGTRFENRTCNDFFGAVAGADLVLGVVHLWHSLGHFHALRRDFGRLWATATATHTHYSHDLDVPLSLRAACVS